MGVKKEKNLYLGVDPGYTGAIALYDFHKKELVDVKDMPIRKYKSSTGKNIKRVNEEELSMYIELHRDMINSAIIEDVGVITRIDPISGRKMTQGVVSMFNFGFSAGVIQGVIAANGIPIFAVKPTIWKLNLGLTSNKTLSLEKAKAHFPNFETKFLRQKDNGRAEAALLAKYGEKIFGTKKFESLI